MEVSRMRPVSSCLLVLALALPVSLALSGLEPAAAAPAMGAVGPGRVAGSRLTLAPRPFLGAAGRLRSGTRGRVGYGPIAPRFSRRGLDASPFGADYGVSPFFGAYGVLLPFTGTNVTARIGEPLDPWFGALGRDPDPVVVAAPCGPGVAGIAPSPVKPPAIYIVQSDRKPVRAGRARIGESRPPKVQEFGAASGPRLITLGPGRT